MNLLMFIDLETGYQKEYAVQDTAAKEWEDTRMRNKKWRILTAAILTLVLCFGLMGCQGDKENAGDPAAASDGANDSDGKIKIGYAMRTIQEERWQRDKEYVEKWAKEAGVELIVQVANGDSSTQISQIENLATQDIDVLMVVPVDTNALSNTLNKVHEQGIKILAYDEQVEAWNDAMVGYDSFEIGRQIAGYVAELKKPGNYIFLYGDASSGESVQNMVGGFHDVFDDFLSQDGNKLVMEQYCKDWAASEGMAYVENALSVTGNDITGVICMNDGIASGAIQALDAQGLTAYVTGQDAELTAIKRIMEGKQTSTLYKDSAVLSKAAIDTAIKLAKGEEITSDKKCTWGGNTEAPFIVVDAVVVTKDNIQDVIIDGGVYTEEEIESASE